MKDSVGRYINKRPSTRDLWPRQGLSKRRHRDRGRWRPPSVGQSQRTVITWGTPDAANWGGCGQWWWRGCRGEAVLIMDDETMYNSPAVLESWNCTTVVQVQEMQFYAMGLILIQC